MEFDANSLIQELNDQITKEVKEIVKDTIREVVEASPTPQNSAGFSVGSYVRSHRVALDQADDSYDMVPEGEVDEQAASKAMELINKVDDLIKEPCVRVVISNNVPHALDVETGENWQKTPGYEPYAKAEQKLKGGK